MLSLLLFVSAPAQLPDSDTLFADFNLEAPLFGTAPGSLPRGFVSDGTTAYFHAVGQNGRELWSTDGTAAGTFEITDLAPATQSSIVGADLTAAALAFLPGGSGAAVFSGDSPQTGQELWRLDGPQGPVTAVADIRPGASSSFPMDFVEFQGELWFLADDGVHGRELWKTDGTALGTSLAVELAPGPDSLLEEGTDPWPVDGRLASIGGKLIVAARAADDSLELYATDGTQGGTQKIFDVPVAEDYFPFAGATHATVGGRLIFEIESNDPMSGVWVTDGTAAGTERMVDPGEDLLWVRSDGVEAYLSIATGTSGSLVVTDGTPASNVQLMGAGFALRNPSPAPGVFFNGELYLTALVAEPTVLGSELVKTDGTPAGTVLAADLRPGVGGSAPINFSTHAGELFFQANLGNGVGNELYRSDGTSAGTVLTGDVGFGLTGLDFGEYAASQVAVPFASTANGLVFPLTTGDLGSEPWVVGAVGSPTAIDIDDIAANGSSNPNSFVRVGADLFVVAPAGPQLSSALFRVPGDASGPPQLLDLIGNGDGYGPFNVVAHRDGVAFTAPTVAGSFERSVWWTDGNVFTRLTDPTVTDPSKLVSAGEVLYFQACVDGEGCDLFASDGTPDGAVGLFFEPGPLPSSLLEIEAFGTGVAVVVQTGFEFVDKLGFADLATGLVTTVNLPPGTFQAKPSQLTAVGDRLFFASASPSGGRALWVSDGTVAGTQLVAELVSSTQSGQIERFAPYGDGVAFTVRTIGRTLWRSDGTAAGTIELGAFPSSSMSSPLIVAGTQIFGRTWADSGLLVPQLMVSDGTVAGTGVVADLVPDDAAIVTSGPFEALGDGYLLLAVEDENGIELWQSDGSPQGTFALVDAWPGVGSSGSNFAERVGASLWFDAIDPFKGDELHVTNLALAGTSAVEPIGFGCGSAAPGLGASNGPRLGQSFDVAVSAELPSAPVALYVDLDLGPLAEPSACNLLLPQPLLLGTTVADGAGVAGFPLSVPNDPALVGEVLYLQAFALAAGEPFLGLGSLTNALEALIGS